MGKSILAVVVGYVAVVAPLATAYAVMLKWFSEKIPHAGSVLTTSPLIGLGVVFACCGVFGGWITALVAGRREFQHGIFLAIVIIVLGILKPFLVSNAEPLVPHFVLVFAGAIGAVAGGALSSHRAATTSHPN